MKRYLFLAAICLLPIHSVQGQILVEAFRSIGCLNCVDPDHQFETFMNAHPQYGINIVYIHNNIATSDDPFYAASKADVDARMIPSFYNVFSDPVLYISGFNGGSGGTYESNWEKLSADPASAQYSGTVAATASVGSTGMLNVDLHLDGTSKGIQVRAYAMLVESGISYTNTESYGNPPGNIWNNVFRAMIPSSTGGVIFDLNGPRDYHYAYNLTGKTWNLKNCKIYAFVQEVPGLKDNSHPIDGFTVAQITQSVVSPTVKEIGNFISAPVPNPSNIGAQIPFHLISPTNVKITISDDLGREVETIFNEFAEGSSFATFTPKNLSRGIYYARMYAGGTYIGMQKIVFAP